MNVCYIHTHTHTHIYIYIYALHSGFLGGTVVKNLPASAGDARDGDLIPGLERSAEVRNGNLLQCFCLENSMDK